MVSLASSKYGQIRPTTAELAVLERLENPYVDIKWRFGQIHV